MKMRMATNFLHRRTEQTGVTQIWWVVKQKTASFQTYPFLSITHFSQKKKKSSLDFQSALSCPSPFWGLANHWPHSFSFTHFASLIALPPRKILIPFLLICSSWKLLFQSQRNIPPSKGTGTHHFFTPDFGLPIGMNLLGCFDFVFSFWVWVGLFVFVMDGSW